MFGKFLTMATIPNSLSNIFSHLTVNPAIILSVILCIYLLLSCFIEAFTLLAIGMVLLFPITLKLGFNSLWVGVLISTIAGIGMLLPPAGCNLRIAQQIDAEHTNKEIIFSLFPFVVLMIITVGLLIIFPQIVLWLPNTMFR